MERPREKKKKKGKINGGLWRRPWWVENVFVFHPFLGIMENPQKKKKKKERKKKKKKKKKKKEKERKKDSQYGPPPPIAHGVLRLIVTLDGEDVIDCEPILGYLHRGMEKIADFGGSYGGGGHGAVENVFVFDLFFFRVMEEKGKKGHKEDREGGEEEENDWWEGRGRRRKTGKEER